MSNANANPGSAFARMGEKNRDLIYGKRPRDDSEEDYEEEEEEETISKHIKLTKTPAKKQRIIIKPRKPAKKPFMIPVAPVIENWRPAGGDVFEKPRKRKKKEESSATLGIARIATWRLDKFMETLQTQIEEHAEIEDIVTRELVHGGESVTDIWVEFESEELAETIKEKFDGEIIHERKLQVKFA